MSILDKISAYHDELTAIRRDIHMHPELGFEEERTSDIVAEKLKGWGCEVARGIGKTGVVGTLRVGNAHKSIGLRADMDCLPMQEMNGLPHASKFDGKMHGCGHDGHTTMLLGAARYLASTKNFDGTVHFIFQPAEEGLGGADAMLADGLFDKFPCDAIFGMHNRPSLEPGKFAIRTGPMMAGGASWDISIKGKGAHGARPESGIDPVVVASYIATALQTIVSRNMRPQDTAVLSITQIHAGDAYNVIPETAVMRGTARCFTKENMKLIEDNMRRIASSVAEGFGATAELSFRGKFPPLVNHPEETDLYADCAAALVGEENVERNGNLVMGSEDFASMLLERPGAYMLIGGGGNSVGETSCEVHNPGYDFNDKILPLGAALYAQTVERFLQKEDV